MDCRKLKYAEESFDLIIDKSTIDALLCGSRAFKNVARLLREGQRVLRTGGYYMAISYGRPEAREFHFKRDHLRFDLQTIKIEREANGHQIVST